MFQIFLILSIFRINTGFAACTNLPIIMYHHIRPNKEASLLKQSNLNVSPENFEKQIAKLKNQNYTFVNLNDVYNILSGNMQKPSKAIALTFDDGYKDNFSNALPILKKYDAKASLMLTTGLVEGGDYLDWQMTKDMKSSGKFEFYNHTWSHPNLSKTETKKVQWEIETSQKQIEDNLGTSEKIIAYPYGSYNTKIKSLASSLGFKLGITTKPGSKLCLEKIMELPRIRAPNTASLNL